MSFSFFDAPQEFNSWRPGGKPLHGLPTDS